MCVCVYIYLRAVMTFFGVDCFPAEKVFVFPFFLLEDMLWMFLVVRTCQSMS